MKAPSGKPLVGLRP